MTTSPQLKRGEVWQIDLDPTVGVEMQKVRPVVVISSDAAGKLPIKLVAPITGWDARYSGNFWLVKVNPTAGNGLSKASAVDVLQSRGVDLSRFKRKLGRLDAATMEEIAIAMSALVEHL
ncbi:MAG: type II toxin-antitoxin system PemK/MazF family toxin [Geobacter sp.]|nr:type II toxin-antitoxin system PemK/MazF family toxin [Geobacter sp.]